MTNQRVELFLLPSLELESHDFFPVEFWKSGGGDASSCSSYTQMHVYLPFFSLWRGGPAIGEKRALRLK